MVGGAVVVGVGVGVEVGGFAPEWGDRYYGRLDSINKAGRVLDLMYAFGSEWDK